MEQKTLPIWRFVLLGIAGLTIGYGVAVWQSGSIEAADMYRCPASQHNIA